MNLELRNYFLNILAKKDFSEFELIQKATLKGFTDVATHEVLENLKAQNFVNDQRLAENILSYYGGKKGKLWLSQKMQQRKIDTEIIKNTLDTIEIVDSKLKDKLAQKFKINDWNNLDPAIRQKVLAFLYRQGFTSAQSILKNWTSLLD